MNKCYYCGLHHEGVCARVQSIEYYPDGGTKRVTFHKDAPVVQVIPLGIGSITAYAHASEPATPGEETT